MDSAEQHREKERQLEQEVDRLRAEATTREERVADIEKELHALRKYKETNDIEVFNCSLFFLLLLSIYFISVIFQALNMDLRIMREKMVHLEESLAAENKLKQELFRALGDAKANNAHLQSKILIRFAVILFQHLFLIFKLYSIPSLLFFQNVLIA